MSNSNARKAAAYVNLVLAESAGLWPDDKRHLLNALDVLNKLAGTQ